MYGRLANLMSITGYGLMTISAIDLNGTFRNTGYDAFKDR